MENDESSLQNQHARWYAVQTKARQETIAKQHLCNQTYEVLLPMIRAVAKRKCSSMQPLFPGYLFVCLELNAQSIAPIRSTRGVVKLVGFGNSLLPVPCQFIQELQSMVNPDSELIEFYEKFNTGDEVVVLQGSLAGFKGIYNAKTGVERVVVLMNILGNQTPVTVAPSQLAKVI